MTGIAVSQLTANEPFERQCSTIVAMTHTDTSARYPVQVRQLAAGLGAGAVVFGAIPALFPRFFARLFGIAAAAEPTVVTAIRSVGVRDAVLGVGLLRAASAGDKRALNQWLLARAACDAGDAVSVALALAAGERNPRFIGLGVLALGAAALGVAIARGGRSNQRH